MSFARNHAHRSGGTQRARDGIRSVYRKWTAGLPRIGNMQTAQAIIGVHYVGETIGSDRDVKEIEEISGAIAAEKTLIANGADVIHVVACFRDREHRLSSGRVY